MESHATVMHSSKDKGEVEISCSTVCYNEAGPTLSHP